MEDRSSGWAKNLKLSTAGSRKSASKASSVPEAKKDLMRIASKDCMASGSGIFGDAALFLVKVAALETVRRFSRARCPLAWKGIQVLQILICPPFKWIHKWFPFKGLLKAIQTFSRPFLVLSVATALSDQPAETRPASSSDDSQPSSGRDSELSSMPSSVSTRSSDEALDHLPTDNWLQNFLKELENQGLSLPERINEVDLHGFYAAANGDLSSMLAAVKKTIRWRETYRFLSGQELELWSNMVFWHGYDVMHRPCLVVRLGLAISLPAQGRPRFAQAIVSQVEYGILHLIGEMNPQITVLLDCERLPPLRLPVQMMKSCSALFQNHFPDRLGSLFVIRLPPVVRVIAQTFIQILKPVTRQKLKFLGEKYSDILSEHLQTLPAYLGGECSCSKCSSISFLDKKDPRAATIALAREMEAETAVSDNDVLPAVDFQPQIDMNVDHNLDRMVRTAVIAILMIWVFIAFIGGFFDPETRPFPFPLP